MNHPAMDITPMQRRANDIRARLFRPVNAVKDSPPAEAPVVAPVAVKVVYRRYDHHALNWRGRKAQWYAAQAAANGSPMQRYIRGRCEADGFHYADVIGPCRERRLTDFRQKLMYEIKTQVKPEISFAALGNLFGGRDHTTAIHACQRFGYETKSPRRFTKAEIRKIKQLHDAGATNADIAKILDCHTDSVRRYTDETYIQKRKVIDAAQRKARNVKARRAAAKARAQA